MKIKLKHYLLLINYFYQLLKFIKAMLKEKKEKKEAEKLREAAAEAAEAATAENSENSENSEKGDDASENTENSETAENTEKFEKDASEKDDPQAPDPELAEALEVAYCLGAGISPEELAKAKLKLAEIADAVNSGEFNPEILRMALNMVNYERDMANARKRGGAAEAAAIPHLGGTKGIGSASRSDSIFNVARGAQ